MKKQSICRSNREMMKLDSVHKDLYMRLLGAHDKLEEKVKVP